MDVFEALFTRRSIRSYSQEPVTEEELECILKAGMNAPSSHNNQPWHFVVVCDAQKRQDIAANHPYAKMAAEAQAAIIVCADPTVMKEPGFWQQDCSAALENMLIAARGLNVGTVWCGMYPYEDRVAPIRNILGIPENINMLGMIVLGHPAKPFATADRYKRERIHRDRW